MNTNRLILVCCLFVGLLGFYACEEEPETFEPIDQFNMFETLLADENYSLLAQALTKAGLANRLEGNGAYTIFAPDNDVMNTYLDGQDLDDVDGEELQRILSYHILSGTWLAEDLPNNGYLTTISETGPFEERLSLYFEKDNNSLLLNNQYQAELSSDTLVNGVIHSINNTMETPVIADFIAYDSRLSFLQETLTNYFGTDQLYFDFQNSSSAITLFAPVSEAFPTLFDTLGIPAWSQSSPQTQLDTARFVLNFHILQDTAIYLDNVADSTFLKTSVPFRDLLALRDSVTNELLIKDFHGDIARIEEGDIQARNGRLHIIDRVLNVFSN